MGQTGRAIMFVTPEQGHELTEIEKLINQEIPAITVPGFEPSPPETPAAKPPEPDLTRHEAPVFGETPASGEAPAASAPIRKTLGAKFRPARRRRL